MKTFQLFALIFLIFCASFVNGQPPKKVVHPIKPKDFNGLGLTSDFTVLAEGSQGKVETPFVFVARDVKTYLQLQKLVDDLPAAKDIDFKKYAVVAGFAGDMSSGGWTVEIRRAAERISIDLRAPGKGVMTAQIITYPFKVSLIPVDEKADLPLDLAAIYTSAGHTFQLKSGDFVQTVGLAGQKLEFKTEGTIRMLTYAENTTILFDLKGTGANNKRQISAIASGSLKGGNIVLARVDAGSLIENPRPPFKVTGMIKDKTVSLKFEPLASKVTDGFLGKGSLEAVWIR